jgi:hypothetical protein
MEHLGDHLFAWSWFISVAGKPCCGRHRDAEDIVCLANVDFGCL